MLCRFELLLFALPGATPKRFVFTLGLEPGIICMLGECVNHYLHMQLRPWKIQIPEFH